MKRTGILNAELSKAVAAMGHGDIILIGDVGCPWPRHEMTKVVDLAITDGIPKVCDVVKVVLQELEVESYIVAHETKEISPKTYDEFKKIISQFKNKGNELKEKEIQHPNMKDLWLNGALNGEEVKVFVRCGERTPYCYIALVAGVDF
jgi:D-ribose pyranase